MALVHALEAVAGRQPESTALAWRAATVWTYRDLQSAIAVVERTLARKALGSGARVALLLRNSPQYVSAYYGTLAAGCVAVPLNVQERAPVLVNQIEHSGASLVIGDIDHQEWGRLKVALRNSVADVVGLRLHDGVQALADFERAVETSTANQDVARNERRAAGDHDLASIIYTSGTTAGRRA